MSASPRVSSDSNTKLTYQHFQLFPDDGNRHEIIGGVHYLSAAPVPYRQKLSRQLQYSLGGAIESNGFGKVIGAPVGVQLSLYDVVQPDVIVVLNEDQIRSSSLVTGAPGLVVEILAPSARPNDLRLKRELYARNGVREFWIVDPDEKAVYRHVLQNRHYEQSTRHTDAIQFGGLQAVCVDLITLW